MISSSSKRPLPSLIAAGRCHAADTHGPATGASGNGRCGMREVRSDRPNRQRLHRGLTPTPRGVGQREATEYGAVFFRWFVCGRDVIHDVDDVPERQPLMPLHHLLHCLPIQLLHGQICDVAARGARRAPEPCLDWRIRYPMLATFTKNSAKSTTKSIPSQREMRLSCVRR